MDTSQVSVLRWREEEVLAPPFKHAYISYLNGSMDGRGMVVAYLFNGKVLKGECGVDVLCVEL